MCVLVHVHTKDYDSSKVETVFFDLTCVLTLFQVTVLDILETVNQCCQLMSHDQTTDEKNTPDQVDGTITRRMCRALWGKREACAQTNTSLVNHL